jgi:hypothetical protein
MSIRRWWLGASLLGAWLMTLALSSAPALAAPVLPTQDAFYSYSGALGSAAPGTVLRTRSASFNAAGLTVPVTTTQVLYRSTDELGDPTVAVATVVQPLVNAASKIVSYQWAYDGLAANCEPSYAIGGGSPTEDTNAAEQILMVPLLAAGDTVVVSDYESEDNDFAAGREEGDITLDGIRAAEGLLGVPGATPVALMGYSGGAIASDWAAEEAPTYAPNLDIVGTAMGGIAVDLAHNLSYVNGSQEWSGAIPAALVGIARAFHIDLSDYLSSYGLQVTGAVGASCLEADLGSYPGLTYQQLLKPQYTNIDQVPPFVNALNTLIMGSAGTPEEPLFMGVGNADGTGDDVMVDADDEALANEYCQRGVPVQFTTYQNEDHGTAALAFLPSAVTWVLGRLSGVPADNGCASIPAGDALTPLTAAGVPSTGSSPRTGAPKTPKAAKLQLQYRSVVRRTVRLRLRAVNGALGAVTLRLLSARGHVLAQRTLKRAARGRLLSVTLVAHAQLGAGTYRITARSAGRLLGERSFRIRAKARARPGASAQPRARA